MRWFTTVALEDYGVVRLCSFSVRCPKHIWMNSSILFQTQSTKICKQSAMPKKLKTVDQILTEKHINIL